MLLYLQNWFYVSCFVLYELCQCCGLAWSLQSNAPCPRVLECRSFVIKSCFQEKSWEGQSCNSTLLGANALPVYCHRWMMHIPTHMNTVRLTGEWPNVQLRHREKALVLLYLDHMMASGRAASSQTHLWSCLYFRAISPFGLQNYVSLVCLRLNTCLEVFVCTWVGR